MNPRSTSQEPIADPTTAVAEAMSATEFLRERDRGGVEPDHLLRATLERARDNEELNALSYLDEDGLRHGPVHSGRMSGVPVLVKDSIDTCDAPTTSGTPGLRGRIPPADAPVVTALRRAGAVIAGKTTQDELCLGAGGYSPLWGTTRNPLDASRTAGGSSSGAAAAVAAGIVPAALGSDTLGSARVPASFCGIFGFRPTVGRYSSEGTVPVSHSRDTPGPLARSMDDVLLLDSVLSDRPLVGTGKPLRELTFGVNPDHLEGLDDEVLAAFQRSRGELESAGAAVREVNVSDLEQEGDALGFTIAGNEFVPGLRNYLAERYPDLAVEDVLDGVASEDVQVFVDFLRNSADADAYRSALTRRQEIQEEMRRRMDERDVVAVLHPTSPHLPGPADAPKDPNAAAYLAPAYLRYIRFSMLAGALSVPALTVPVPGESGEMPVGIELRGRHGDDESVLRAGSQLATLLS